MLTLLCFDLLYVDSTVTATVILTTMDGVSTITSHSATRWLAEGHRVLR